MGMPSRRLRVPREPAQARIDLSIARPVATLAYLAGSLTLIGSLALPAAPHAAGHSAMRVIAGLLALAGLLCLRMDPSKRWQLRAAVVSGILLVSALMAVARPVEITPFFYLWPLVFSAYIFSRRDLATDLLIFWVTLGIAVFGFSADPMKAVMFIGSGVSVTLTALVVMVLRERVTVAFGKLKESDGLTKLPNRRQFRRRLDVAVARAARGDAAIAVAIVDLDGFREINDTLGHQNGDVLLAEIASRVAAATHPADTVARLGGDELGLILTDVKRAPQTLWDLRGVIEREIEVRGIPVSVQGSIGYALAPRDSADPHLLLQRADVAMYAAKERHAGVMAYDAELDSYDPDNLTLISELRHAIDAGELVLHYQPQVALSDDRTVGVEALVRWEHPRLGLLPPGRFIPLAERTDLIDRLTEWVLRTALSEIRDLGGAAPTLSVSVNASARSVSRLAFADEVIATLQALDVAPERLVIEVTETTLLADPERAAKVLARLAGAGVRISIDDFGSGQTSLGYLSDLPVHELKIDRSFVTDMSSHRARRAVVRSIIELGHNLGMSVIAEGVETREALEHLEAFGCDVIQGFLRARPMPPAALRHWLGNALRASPDGVPPRVVGAARAGRQV